MKTMNNKPQQTLSWWEKTNNEASMLSKWIALYEAVNIVAEKAEQRGIAPEDIVYKPKPIRDYITATQDIILKKILQEDYNIEICYSEDEEPNPNLEIDVIQ